MARIAIIGVGALGSRHLQALARMNGPLRVDLVDPSDEARERAITLFVEGGGDCQVLSQWNDVYRLDQIPDVAIVATNSRERMPILKYLCEIGCRYMILEKFLFTRHAEYQEAAEAIETTGASVWVNCARRTAPRYYRLKELIAGRPISYRVEGTNWGLACNVIHHLDEWTSLAQVSKVTLSGHLQAGTVPARRQGYLDVIGSLTGTAGRSSFTALSSPGQPQGPPGDRTTTISCGGITLTVGQTSQELLIHRGDHLIARESYPAALQSEATAWHVTTILAGGEPSLPRYAQSAALHLALLDVLLPHFKTNDPTLTECPIT